MAATSYTGARVFDGTAFREGALVVEDGHVLRIGAPEGHVVDLPGGVIAPGFIDLQVNGAGGVQLAGDADVARLSVICETQGRLGATGCLPTLITDTFEATARVVEAGIAAARARVPGFLGLHLEGPHLDPRRKGAHDPALIRPMDDRDLALLTQAARQLPALICTVAPEAVSAGQIAALAAAGAVVSLGHSDCGAATAGAAMAAGARCATHLFNAMSQLGNREPGIVGAVLDRPEVFAGLIADGIHVHPASIGVAMRAKRGPGRIFLVTDAMSQTGTDIQTLTLNGRTITRADGALRLADGTLAGADLDMIDAVNFMADEIGIGFEEAVRMATAYPAEAMGIEATHGHLRPGAIASFVHLGNDRQVRSTWINAEEVWRG